MVHLLKCSHLITRNRKRRKIRLYNELTQVDIDKMKREIEERIARRPALREAVKAAKELGDLSENDEYRSARREKNSNDSRIRYLENMIRTAKIIDVSSNEGEVGLFDEVGIYYPEDDERRTIRIVTTLRNDVFNDCISKESPVGKAILGHRVGDTVTVDTGKIKYPILIESIKKGSDDDSLPITSY